MPYLGIMTGERRTRGCLPRPSAGQNTRCSNNQSKARMLAREAAQLLLAAKDRSRQDGSRPTPAADRTPASENHCLLDLNHNATSARQPTG